ncbi:DUF4197 family protein [Zhongshania aquimaris]|uniref:DUF4197 domain-containing protein n=1 Tax=Zhongshania aquimaris TaxID=2857107 RepID=A0ABS6VQ47_9GAMM|nr:DUF4197 family protein [Zhongshania aquimaris]MBW2940444.1 DUF4197 domain-containing protein [Zhongshania aquimaris]
MRVIAFVFMTLLTSGCASMFDGMSLAAQAKFQQVLANTFAQKLKSGIDLVVDQLAAKGGFLDDRLVRVLLPPPLGLVIDVARDLNDKPEAALLEIMINRAAENAIPVAGPILKDIVANMEPGTLQKLLHSPRSAATELLVAEGAGLVQSAMLPVVRQSLEADGAIKLYEDLLSEEEKSIVSAEADGDVDAGVPAESVSPDRLAQYVVEQAAGTLFKKVAAKERLIRDSLDSVIAASAY